MRCWAPLRQTLMGESVCQTSASRQTESSSVAGTDRFCSLPWKQPLVAAEVLLLFLPPAGPGCWPCSDPQPVLAQPCSGHVSPCSVMPLHVSYKHQDFSFWFLPVSFPKDSDFTASCPFCAEVCFRAAWLRSATVPTVPIQGDSLVPDSTAGHRPSLIRAGR